MRESDSNSTNRSLLALLRELAPHRQLTMPEALRVAELQAIRLLGSLHITECPVPDEVVMGVSRIRIERERNLPVSGSVHWNGRYWIITLNADDHPHRQRFSLMHELKHLIDHKAGDVHYRDRPTSTAREQAERAADYFAACVLMPRGHVHRMWADGHHSVPQLARQFEVSQAALRYRLSQLGLTDRSARCEVARQAVCIARAPRPKRRRSTR